ncbi:hypothetical protein [Streptomyces virginiae]|uniref:hypothetical protein n=1 Tax=Streptomyces virginiae TaxID=1961 RepID=UPI0036F56DAA
MGREAAGFRRDLGIDLSCCCVAIFEHAVLVIELGEPLSQGQLVPVAPVNPERELPRFQLAGEHAPCERPHGSFVSSLTADRMEGEAEFGECRGKQVVDVVVRLCARAGGEDPKVGVSSPATSASQAESIISLALISPTLQRAAWSGATGEGRPAV